MLFFIVWPRFHVYLPALEKQRLVLSYFSKLFRVNSIFVSWTQYDVIQYLLPISQTIFFRNLDLN